MKHIPKINLFYWILMIIATTTGEIVGNYISRDLGLGYKIGSIILVSIFVLAILYSILTKKFNQLFSRVMLMMFLLFQLFYLFFYSLCLLGLGEGIQITEFKMD